MFLFSRTAWFALAYHHLSFPIMENTEKSWIQIGLASICFCCVHDLVVGRRISFLNGYWQWLRSTAVRLVAGWPQHPESNRALLVGWSINNPFSTLGLPQHSLFKVTKISLWLRWCKSPENGPNEFHWLHPSCTITNDWKQDWQCEIDCTLQ